MSNRPSIPAEIAREILIESGHQCAVCCAPTPLELAHIIPWHKSREHKAEDLICLCASCHQRADLEKWGAKTLREYKRKPCVLRHYEKAESVSEPTTEVELTIKMELKNFDEKLQRWLQSALAGFLGISPNAVRITSIEKSSVKVTVELPTESAERLISAYQRKDLDLAKFLAPLVLLDLRREAPKRERIRAMPDKVTRLRIFVASPGDVLDERERLKLVVDELNRIPADRLGLILDLLDWRTHVAPCMGRPQKVILDQLALERWDVFVGILWARFGTPPGATHPETGKPFLSGTEEEFTLAYQAWKETGRPQILFYRCMQPIPPSIDVAQLQPVQEFFKEFEATGRYPGLYRTYEMLEDFERRVREDLTRLLFDYSEEQVQATRWPELAKQIAELKAAEPQPPPPPHVPFTNREDELRRILSSFAPPYHLIDAPAGYGKTILLTELRRRFEEQKWVCAYVSVQEHRNVPDIAQTLAAELGISLTPDTDARRLGLDLGRQIIQQRGEDFEEGTDACKGVVLLIDVDKSPWTSLLPTVDALFTDFIPGVEYNLHGFEPFKKGHNPFRVIFAGRYLAGKTPKATPFSLTVLKLTPFDYEVIRDTAKAYLSDQRGISQLAAHLMYYTGGHPGCMARVLKLYKEQEYSPDDFFRYSAEEIWDGVVCLEANAVRDDVRRELRRIFDDLSIFRYLDYNALRRLLDQAVYPEHASEFDLADELTSTYLMDWKGRLLHDSITRRLVAIRLWREIGPQSFAKHCQRAQEICAARLQEPNAQTPERWAIEYLFQFLQQYTEDIQARQKREEIRQSFLEKTVPEALQLLIGVEGRNAREEHNALKRELEIDWEFHFTVNYFLRQDEYSDEPYEKLQGEIDDFFSSTA